MEAEARRLFDRLGTPISPRARVGDLRVGDQQMVEIAKALSFDAAILIMDEPTSALSDAEVARLFRVIDDLRRAGTTVLYISHKMDEVFTLADRMTVLRDGRFVADVDRATRPSPTQVVRWMVGREIAELDFDAPRRRRQGRCSRSRTCRCPARPTAAGRALSDISFELRAGEVLGIAGLLGAGRTELLEALFGASPAAPRRHDRARRPGRPVPRPRPRRSPPGSPW